MATEARGINRRAQIVPTDSFKERFFAKIDKAGPDDCWLWNARSTRADYGAIKQAGKVFSSHCVSWSLENGDIPKGMVIAHKCNNKRCCNPEHLEAVTPGKNNLDARQQIKFVRPKGVEIEHAVLNDSLVTEMRKQFKAGGTIRGIAREFGFKRTTVGNAIRGKTWKHVELPPVN